MICLQLLCHPFSSKTSKKNSTTRRVLSTYCETQELQNFHTLTSKNVVLQRFFFSDSFSMKNSREIANLLFADMSHLTRI